MLLKNKIQTVEEFLRLLDLIWQNCIDFNQKGSEISNQAAILRRLVALLVKKLRVFELQQPADDQEMGSQQDDDEDFGLLVDSSLYVKFDDKIKLAEMLKSCTRDKLTRVVQMIRGESGHDQPVVDEMGQGRYQLKIDQI